MALTNDDNMIMPVAPMSNNSGGNGCFGNGDWSWIILLLLICGGGAFGGFGGYGGGYEFPWLFNTQNSINANTDNGFDHLATQNAIGEVSNAVTNGFGNVQTALCGGFAGVNATVNGAQNAIASQLYSNQIADLERSFASQTASTMGMNAIQSQLAQCCCDNRLATCQTQNIVQNEGNATRYSDSQNTMSIIEATNKNGQAIIDKLCQLELDGVKAQVDAKNDRIAELTTQLNMATLRESQTAQNAFIAQGFANEVDQLYNRLSSCPVPSTPVYGRTPIFTCGNNMNCSCGL